MRATNQKKHWTISGNGNEGDEKTSQRINIAAFFIFLFPEMNLVFFGMFFHLPKLNVFFSKIGKNSMRALGRRKKHMFFFCNARPKSNARAHLKQRKNIVALPGKCTAEFTNYVHLTNSVWSHLGDTNPKSWQHCDIRDDVPMWLWGDEPHRRVVMAIEKIILKDYMTQ